MAEAKTQRTRASVSAFLNAIADPDRRKEARALAAVIRKSISKAPAMWGPSIVGYGEVTYTGSNGKEVEWFPIGFSPRKGALTLYLMGGLRTHADLIRKLGPHKVGGGCLYLTRPAEVDQKVLAQLIKRTYDSNRSATRPAATTRSRTRKA